MDDNNVDRLMQAINQFGFGSLGLVADDFSDPNAIIQLGYEPYRIDLLMNVEGVDFANCYARRIEAELDSTPIKFLSLRDLIKAKQAAGRLQDLADAEQLEKLSQNQVIEEE